MMRTAIAAAARRRISPALARFAHALAQADAPQVQTDDVECHVLKPSWFPLYKRLQDLPQGRPPGSVAAEMDEWVRRRCPLSEDQIVAYVRKFRKYKKPECALELMDWMEARGSKSRRGHHAMRLGLVSRVHGIEAAEEYFWNLPDIFKSIETYTCLLNCYGCHSMADKGLELYEKMKAMHIVPNTLLYSNLLALYLKAGQPEKIPSTFEEMQARGISADKFTYFTLIESYIAMGDLGAAEKVLEELQKVPPVHWSLYTLMAHNYIKLELFGKAEVALKKAEEVMDKADLSSWYFLLSLYARSGSSTEVKRVWVSLQSTFKKCLNRSYLVMLQALSMVDDFDSLRQMFQEWQSSHEKYDIKIVSFVIKTFLDNGMIDEAEAIRQSVIAQGHYKENMAYMFVKFYLDKSNVNAALEILRDAKNMVTAHNWVPSKKHISTFLKHYEESKDVDGVESFCECLRKLECLDAEAYKALMRTYIAAGRSNTSIAHRMQDDCIHIEPETVKLLQSVSGSSDGEERCIPF